MNKFILILKEQYERFRVFQLSEKQRKLGLDSTKSNQENEEEGKKGDIKPDEVIADPTFSDQIIKSKGEHSEIKRLPPPGLPIQDEKRDQPVYLKNSIKKLQRGGNVEKPDWVKGWIKNVK